MGSCAPPDETPRRSPARVVQVPPEPTELATVSLAITYGDYIEKERICNMSWEEDSHCGNSDEFLG